MLILTILIFLLLSVFIIDLQYHLIPNRITIPCVLIGWTLAYSFDSRMFLESVIATVIGFCLLLYPYIKGGVGGGDVKFLAAVGSLGGISFLLHTVMWGFIIAFFYSLLLIYDKEGLKGLKKYLKAMGKPTKLEQKSLYFIPLGSCISIGGLLVMIIQMW